MILVSGSNSSYNLGAKSNNKDCIFGNPAISPPVAMNFDASLISSFSSYMDHTVIITKNSELFAIGDNKNNQISSSLPKQILKQFTKFTITDNQNQPCIPISAVCSAYYTLYLVFVKGSNTTHLICSYTNKQKESPLFQKTENKNYISIFGGERNSAAIDTEGSMTFITWHTYNNHSSIYTSFDQLPEKEKAVSIACCNKFYIILGESGKVFRLPIIRFQKLELITELNGMNIVQLNGLSVHSFAVSSKGRVFAYGENFRSCIGFKNDVKELKKFTKIPDLKGKFIKEAYCGYDHSLFLTSDGKILTCGSNDYGQLPLNEKIERGLYYCINESVVTSGAEFCVIGNPRSFIFIRCNPQRSPNKKITNFKPLMIPSFPEEKEENELEKLRKENALLHEKIKSFSEENESLKAKNESLKEENELLKSDKKSLKAKNESLEEENELLISDKKSLKAKNDSLKEENELLKSDKKSLKAKNKSLKKQVSELKETKSEVNIKEDQKIEHIQPKEMQIFDVESIEKLRKIESVGRGGQSEVSKVSRKEICALKVLDTRPKSKTKKKKSTNTETDNFESLKRFMQEYEIINSLNHKNIIKTYGICFGDEDHAPSILFEFCPFNLNDLIEEMSSTEKVIAIYE